MLTFTIEDQKCEQEITIYIGQSAEENWKLIDDASQNDLWFHVAEHPSPHVIIKVPEKAKVSPKTIKYAAVLCKQYSKLKSMKKLSIMYTDIKHVTKADKVGSVTTSKTKFIVI
ncbi:MAG: protein of unknown function DUF814 [Edafosvirus sp.]|uniref:NFACT RNA-binding domain-containing protein n=1 Tax=Edafosvirus sp. TaxID=2487765 RepID=A0A3G4ZV74_9VIRU|nr:MAG: protein of unknown function DUF814 [Edafosvirus sp.]